VQSLANQTKLPQCVEECPEEYVDISNICILNSTVIDFEKTFQEMMDSLKSTWYYILIICIIAFIFSYIFLVLFRYAANEVIWIINIGFVVLVVVFCIFLAARQHYAFMMLFLFAAFIMSAFLFIFRTRIDLVAKLFQEASKALIDVPGIMFEPLLVSID
jgi:inner membrane protein involved in colicin E2 resistance